ncbi:NudC domain-containing protein 2 [Lamellibrachia satsuma]|nr:NudC domain-containing protein 2 [Lamellibrachia satsuma]
MWKNLWLFCANTSSDIHDASDSTQCESDYKSTANDSDSDYDSDSNSTELTPNESSFDSDSRVGITPEDKKLLVICLPKSDRTAGSCWKSLLDGQYEADPWTWDQMQQKLTLERYQIENPGMDFSGASISGSYQDGGPELPS